MASSPSLSYQFKFTSSRLCKRFSVSPAVTFFRSHSLGLSHLYLCSCAPEAERDLRRDYLPLRQLLLLCEPRSTSLISRLGMLAREHVDVFISRIGAKVEVECEMRRVARVNRLGHLAEKEDDKGDKRPNTHSEVKASEVKKDEIKEEEEVRKEKYSSTISSARGVGGSNQSSCVILGIFPVHFLLISSHFSSTILALFGTHNERNTCHLVDIIGSYLVHSTDSAIWFTKDMVDWPGSICYLRGKLMRSMTEFDDKGNSYAKVMVTPVDFRPQAAIWHANMIKYPNDVYQCMRCTVLREARCFPSLETMDLVGPIIPLIGCNRGQEVPIMCFACHSEDFNMGYHSLIDADTRIDEDKQGGDLCAPSHFHRCSGFIGAPCGVVWYSETDSSIPTDMMGLCGDCYNHDAHGYSDDGYSDDDEGDDHEGDDDEDSD